MHSARWDHDLDLSGKAIGVIGSAASAVQLVPEVAKIAGRLDVYQRTPNYVSPRETRFSEEYLAQAATDPQAAAAAERARASSLLNAVVTLDVPEVLEQFICACANNLAQVADAGLRRKLTPDYPFGSKRGLVSSDWYPTFNRSNVALVTEPILRITRDSIVTDDGMGRRVDAIILATGFNTPKFLSAIPVNGRHGIALNDAWAAGAQAYLGITVSRFPNLFMLYGPNTNNGSIIYQIESQVDYILGKLKMMDEQLLKWIDVKTAAMDRYNAELQEDLAKVSAWQHGVSDYYRSESGLIVTQWPHSMDRYAVQTSRIDGDAYETMAIEHFEKQSAS
jgi:cation diffusion facilitator CzcD-associated flavoprotein CzcO